MAATRIRQDSVLAEAYVPYAKNLARQHRRYMEISGLSAHRHKYTLADGTVITISSSAGIDDIDIVPVLQAEEIITFEEEIIEEYGRRRVAVWMDHTFVRRDRLLAGLDAYIALEFHVKKDGVPLEVLDENTAAVFIIGPQRKFTGEEVEALQQYIVNKGRIFFWFEPASPIGDIAMRTLLSAMLTQLGSPMQYAKMYENCYLWSEYTNFPNHPVHNAYWDNYKLVQNQPYGYYGTLPIYYDGTHKIGYYALGGEWTSLYPTYPSIIGNGDNPTHGDVLYSDPNGVPIISTDLISMCYRSISSWPEADCSDLTPGELGKPEHWGAGVNWTEETLGQVEFWKRRPYRKWGMYDASIIACYGRIIAFGGYCLSFMPDVATKYWYYSNRWVMYKWLGKSWPEYNNKYPFFLGSTYLLNKCPVTQTFKWPIQCTPAYPGHDCHESRYPGYYWDWETQEWKSV